MSHLTTCILSGSTIFSFFFLIKTIYFFENERLSPNGGLFFHFTLLLFVLLTFNFPFTFLFSTWFRERERE